MENLNKIDQHKNIIDVIEGVTEQFKLLKQEVSTVIVGNSKVIDLSIIAILSNGHILFEGPPGVAKTTLVKTLSETFGKMRKALLDKQLELRERRDALERTDTKKLAQLETFGKLLKSPSLAYQKADVINKRRLLVSMTENLELTPNGLAIKWKKAFEMVANRPKPKSSAPGRNRTCIASFGGRHPIR